MTRCRAALPSAGPAATAPASGSQDPRGRRLLPAPAGPAVPLTPSPLGHRPRLHCCGFFGWHSSPLPGDRLRPHVLAGVAQEDAGPRRDGLRLPLGGGGVRAVVDDLGAYPAVVAFALRALPAE